MPIAPSLPPSAGSGSAELGRLPPDWAAVLPAAAAARLADDLAEGQPAGVVNSLTLRQWYTKYHPDSEPIRISTADELEEKMGEEIRTKYPGL